MPAIAAVPWLIPLITGLTAAGTLGTSLYEAAENKGGATGPTAAQQAQLAAQQKQAQQQAAYLSAQTNNGGTPPPTGLTATSPQGTSATSGASSPTDIAAMLKLLGQGSTADLSGGTGSSPQSPPTTHGLQQL